VTTLDPYYDFRDRLLGAVEQDLLGPSSVEEVLEDAPITRYVTGILYPGGIAGTNQVDGDSDTVAASEDVDLPEGRDETTYEDPPVAMSHARYPSSMGLTFAVDLDVSTSLVVQASAAMYEPLAGEGDDPLLSRWRRRALDLDSVELDPSTPDRGRREELGHGLEMFIRIRPEQAGIVTITVALLNTRQPASYMKDADSFFQVGLEVRSSDGAACFVEREGRTEVPEDVDLRSYHLLYRHARTFAAGHGCAAEWKTEDAGERAVEIASAFVPRHDLRLADSNPAITGDALDIAFLTRASRSDVIAALAEICAGYESWIEAREEEASSLEEPLDRIAAEHLSGCREAVKRMRAGADKLKDDDISWEAFRLANKAMLMQRSRASWLAAGKPTPEPSADAGHSWRPFQLAFFLQCIAGIADRRHPDRELADLLWFPTGGGKTEAYLGLIAFTIFLRRLTNGPSGDGVTVLMRYTLRLLTIQQFDRAALLVCCCELIRQSEPRLGSSPIAIGLWIGRGGAPNTLAEARTALDKLRGGLKVEEGNPVQLHQCPWCGTRLSAFEYWIGTAPPRLVIRCKLTTCAFHAEDLPVFVVDEDIYRHRPSLIIATADKFASLPWKPDISALFNRGTASPPPDLIVQDELHLISGPLGTLTGLYETAIDVLCSQDGHPPKVIASTATIRRASDQARGLFSRGMRQFPPPGLDARDSYFAVEAPPSEKGTRRYVGLMAPGTSQTTLLVRTYAALLQAVLTLDALDEVKDPYWTLVGYFNSLRVLGGARMQVQDDVRDRIHLLAGIEPARTIEERIELTSREASSEIPGHLARMAESYPDEHALDVILATNMISVGVDIDRLGLMVVMGQPQSTSEYIQGTSRVGRMFPGLVLTLFNSARSRDRSHYESFEAYHSAIYRQVESTSVTPFSPRARDRGLHAVLIALARMTIGAFTENSGAGEVEACRAELDKLADLIVERVENVDSEQAAAVRAELREVVDAWIARARENPALVFAQPFQPDNALLIDAGKADDAPLGTFPTLWSLRDVDLESNLYLVSG
jgi:hypothetical protein